MGPFGVCQVLCQKESSRQGCAGVGQVMRNWDAQARYQFSEGFSA